MGHILAHAEISTHVIKQLEAITPGESFAHLEAGNFVTDIAQFRDPYANMSAKRQIWLRALLSTGVPILGPLLVFLGLGDVREWMDDLLGKAEPGKRYGALALFFQHVSRIAMHQAFAEDSPIHLITPGGLLAATGLSSVRPLPVAEINRVFDKAFTQYYPYEHVDFPPYLEGPNGLLNYPVPLI
jgi:hypothetical protein